MNIEECRKVVYERKAELEEQLKCNPSPYEKRLILLNLNACFDMFCYLDIIAMGMKPRFIVRPEFNAPNNIKIIEA